MTPLYDDENSHPFDAELVSRESEPVVGPANEVHHALGVIDGEMEWVRREIPQLASSNRQEFSLVKSTEGNDIFEITETKWRDVWDAVDGPMYTDKTFSNRTSVVVKRIHYRYADYKCGNFGSKWALVLSQEDDE